MATWSGYGAMVMPHDRPSHRDCCPACGSHQVIPYAVLVGGSGECGYKCLAGEAMWPGLSCPASGAAEPAGQPSTQTTAITLCVRTRMENGG